MHYKKFYRMQADAFGSLPVLNLFYSSRTHQDGWRYLAGGIASGEPFLLVTGDYGMGKTMLSMMLVRLLKKKSAALVQVTDPHAGFSGILRQMAEVFAIDANLLDEESLLNEIYPRLYDPEFRQHLLIIIDDAQELGVSALARLRAFANFNRDGFFPIQLVFFAHPAFGDLLKDPQLAAMDQRIRRRHRLTPLTLQETKEYIYCRLFKSGAPGAPFFNDDALQEIHAIAKGIPRLINNICDASLTYGALKLETCISGEIVRQAQSASADSTVPQVSPEAARIATHFSAPPVHLASPQQPDSASVQLTAQAAAPVRTRKPLMFATAAVVAAVCLAVVLLVRLYVPETPASLTSMNDMPVLAAHDSAPYTDSSLSSDRGLLAGTPSITAQMDSLSPPAVLEIHAAAAAIPAEVDNQTLSREQFVTADSSVLVDNQTVSSEFPIAAENPVVTDIQTVSPEQTAAPMVSSLPGEHIDLTLGAAGLPGDSSAPEDFQPYTLRLACFNTPESVRNAAKIYARQKLAPFVVHINLEQGHWWIAYTGCFASREEALRAREHSDLPDALIVSMPYGCRIGVFESEAMAADLRSGMQKLGYVPYMLENSDGTVSLFTGVYKHRGNAETLRQALAVRNIDSSIVLLRSATPLPAETHPDGAVRRLVP